jgi:homocysteine S-methyltransferase
MRFDEFVKNASFALSEGSVYERLRRHPSIEFDPYIFHASLIYDDKSVRILEGVHREYIDVAQKHRLPILILTDTWRANQERINSSKFKSYHVNQDNAKFMIGLRESYGSFAESIFIGGQIGPRGDAYKPEEAPSKAEAESFHADQLSALADAGVDLLFAATLPALSEAQGIAVAMSKFGLPYMLSFVIRPEGTLLDGTPLGEAMDIIDHSVSTPPTGYAVNCVHPKIFASGMSALERLNKTYSRRVLSYQANTANLRPEELDGSVELIAEEPAVLANLMLDSYQSFQTLFMGGCCGTDTRHIEQLAKKYTLGSSVT